MNLTVNTKPLNAALQLGIISSNISKFYAQSGVAQVRVEGNMLIINVCAKQILSEIRIKGSADSDFSTTKLLSCIDLKQLVNTFDNEVTTFEFIDGGVVLHSGKSKFTLPELGDASLVSVDEPMKTFDTSSGVPINEEDWKYIKNNQMFAIGLSFAYLIYTYVLTKDNGDVFVCDYESGIFTKSKDTSNLDSDCLLDYTIINTLSELPEHTNLYKVDNSYVIHINQDSFEMFTQFFPRYENENELGSYNSEVIDELLTVNTKQSVVINPNKLNKFLRQIMGLNYNIDDSIKCIFDKNKLIIKAKNGELELEYSLSNDMPEFTLEMLIRRLAPVMSKFETDSISINPEISPDDGEISGILLTDGKLSIAVAGVD